MFPPSAPAASIRLLLPAPGSPAPAALTAASTTTVSRSMVAAKGIHAESRARRVLVKFALHLQHTLGLLGYEVVHGLERDWATFRCVRLLDKAFAFGGTGLALGSVRALPVLLFLRQSHDDLFKDAFGRWVARLPFCPEGGQGRRV